MGQRASALPCRQDLRLALALWATLVLQVGAACCALLSSAACQPRARSRNGWEASVPGTWNVCRLQRPGIIWRPELEVGERSHAFQLYSKARMNKAATGQLGQTLTGQLLAWLSATGKAVASPGRPVSLWTDRRPGPCVGVWRAPPSSCLDGVPPGCRPGCANGSEVSVVF